MKVKSVNYKKVFNLGNYSNEQIGIEIDVEESENPVEVFVEAKKYVEKMHLFQEQHKTFMEAEKIAGDPDNHTGTEVKRAEAFMEDFNKNFADLIPYFMGLKKLNP